MTDYWELANRIVEVSSDEIEAFYARWPGTYLEDRLRNDWLLETGRRRDWSAFSRDYPRFRMNDDREVTCYAILIDHLAGKEVRDAARNAWMAQHEVDDGCQFMAQTLFDDEVFSEQDVWARLRQAAEYNRPRGAHAAAQILGKTAARDLAALWDNPARYLAHHADAGGMRRVALVSLALARMAGSDAGAAALQMSERYQGVMDPQTAAWTWAVIAERGAQSGMPESIDWLAHAWAALPARHGETAPAPDWSDDALAWQVRALLRFGGKTRWHDILRAIDAMTPPARADDAWVYWRARARLALLSEPGHGAAKEGPEAEKTRVEATAALGTLASTLTFYGLLASEDLGTAPPLPVRPAPITPAERAAVRANAGLQRGLALTALDLRDEGRREWNYTLRGMTDRELIAASQAACDVGDWQLCINTSERTKGDIDLAQRYPTPYQRDIATAALGAGVDPAFVFGLIRQETRFMNQIRSQVGASGLMQLMPSTAKWVARKSEIDFRPEQITDTATNLRLGTTYLKMVLDSFGGSQPMAAAAYNAGPARPRRWRGTLMTDPAIWIENVPFRETRDYVKKVISNAAVYSALQSGKPMQLRPRLGPQIGPRDAEQTATDLP